MDNHETFVGEVQSVDKLRALQKEQLAKMRAASMCFDTSNFSSAAAIQNITVMRVYHQITRIIKYTELMDKLEEKMYSSIEACLDNMDVYSPSTWMQLVGLQEKLQKNMDASNKLIQPYLDATWTASIQSRSTDGPSSSIYTSSERENIRNAAQTVLAAITSGGSQDG